MLSSEYPKHFIEELYNAEYEKMFRFAYHILNNTESAKDMVQETFLFGIVPSRRSHSASKTRRVAYADTKKFGAK